VDAEDLVRQKWRLLGQKVSAKDIRELKIDRDNFHGDWNYVIRPRARTVTD
jgi:hypothetical protein